MVDTSVKVGQSRHGRYFQLYDQVKVVAVVLHVWHAVAHAALPHRVCTHLMHQQDKFCIIFSLWFYFSLAVSSGDEAAGADVLHETACTHSSASSAAHQRSQTCTGEQPFSPNLATCLYPVYLFIYFFLRIIRHFVVATVALPSQKLIRLCGEVLAAPTENEEIQFLCIVCAKLKQDPYLVNFFLEVSHFWRQFKMKKGVNY